MSLLLTVSGHARLKESRERERERERSLFVRKAICLRDTAQPPDTLDFIKPTSLPTLLNVAAGVVTVMAPVAAAVVAVDVLAVDGHGNDRP